MKRQQRHDENVIWSVWTDEDDEDTHPYANEEVAIRFGGIDSNWVAKLFSTFKMWLLWNEWTTALYCS